MNVFVRNCDNIVVNHIDNEDYHIYQLLWYENDDCYFPDIGFSSSKTDKKILSNISKPYCEIATPFCLDSGVVDLNKNAIIYGYKESSSFSGDFGSSIDNDKMTIFKISNKEIIATHNLTFEYRFTINGYSILDKFDSILKYVTDDYIFIRNYNTICRINRRYKNYEYLYYNYINYGDSFFYDDILYIINIKSEQILSLNLNFKLINTKTNIDIPIIFPDNYQEERIDFVNKDNLIFLMSYQENY